MNEFRIRWKLNHFVFTKEFNNHSYPKRDEIKHTLERFSSLDEEDKSLLYLESGYFWEEFLERIE